MDIRVLAEKLKQELSFGGKRDDRNAVKRLTANNGALTAPQQRLIRKSIERLSKDKSTDNIRFLLNVSENLKYGVKRGSDLEAFVRKDSNISGDKHFQNNDWHAMLGTAVKKALAANTSSNKPELQAKYDELYPETKQKNTIKAAPAMKWLALNPSKKDEKELITLRNNILNSDEFRKTSENLPPERAEKLQEDKQIARKMLDHFVASSEVSLAEKKDCLKQLEQFMSPEFKLDPQLEGRKPQILREMTEDIVVEIPLQRLLTTKGIDQMQHGICAAIATVRKALAHEHKPEYVKTVLAEVNDQPTIEVYDVTSHDLGKKVNDKKKVNVEKADIDYKRADERGYRIADSGVFHWMNIADTTGSGKTYTQRYRPFDRKNYGLLYDAHFIPDLEGENGPKHRTLRALVKLNGVIKGLTEGKIKKDEYQSNQRAIEDEYVRTSVQTRKAVAGALKEVSPNGIVDLEELTHKVLDPKENGINTNDSELEQKNKIKACIQDEIISPNELKLNESVQKIQKSFVELIHAVKKRENQKTALSQSEYSKKIFKSPAYYELKPEVVSALKEILPENVVDVATVTEKICDPETNKIVGKENKKTGKERIVSSNESKTMQRNKIKVYIQSQVKELDETKLDECAKKIQLSLEQLRAADSKRKKLVTTPTEKALSNDKLFKLAAFYRVKTELELDIPERLEEVAKENHVPRTEKMSQSDHKAAVLKKLEKKGKILPRPVLDDLQKKFDAILLYKNEELNAKNENRKSVYNGEYEFTKEQKAVFNKIEKSFSAIKRDVKRQYRNLNLEDKAFVAELEKAYAKEKYKGAFWATEEGHSGLGREDQIRIVQQATGKPHYVENNVTKAFDYVESGKGNGLLAASMSDKMIAGHAQYIYDICLGKSPDINTGEIKEQRFMLTDNSWDLREFINNFEDEAGNLRTDYGRGAGTELGEGDGFGGKLGFLVKPNGTIGVTEQEYKEVIVVHKPHLKDNPKMVKLDPFIGIETSLFSDTILNGEPPRGLINAVTVMRNIFDIKNRKHLGDLQRLVNSLTLGNKDKIQDLGDTIYKDASVAVAGYIDNGDKKALRQNLAEITEKHTEDAPREIFGASEPERLAKGITNSYIKAVEKIETSSDPELLKQIKIMKALKNVIEKQLGKNTSLPVYIDIKKINDIDKSAIEARNKVMDVVDGALDDKVSDTENPFKNIQTKEDFEAIPEDNKIKQLFRKATMMETAQVLNGGLYEKIVFSKDTNGLDKAHEDLVESQKISIKYALGREVELDRILKGKIRPDDEKDNPYREINTEKPDADKKSRAPQVESINKLNSIYGGPALINWIDAKFDPQSDKDLMKVYKALRRVDDKVLDKHLDNSTDEQLGVKYEEPYSLFQRLKSKNVGAAKVFGEAIFGEKFAIELNVSNKESENLKYSTRPDLMYRRLNILLSYLTIDKLLKQHKGWALEKFKVRPAIPNLMVIPEKDLKQEAGKSLNILGGVSVKLEEAKKEGNKEKCRDLQSDLKMLTDLALITSVQPKYHNDLRRDINKWLKESTQNPESEKTKKMQESIAAEMAKRHVIKEPKDLLESVVDDIQNPEKFAYPEINKEVVNSKLDFLARCLQTAEKLELEISLADKLSTAQMPEIARVFRNPEFGHKHRAKNIAWDSPEGIGVLFGVLEDQANDNSTLKMVLTSFGMVDQAVDSFVGTKPEIHLKRIKMVQKETDEFYKDQKEIDTLYKNWTKTSRFSEEKMNSNEPSDIVEVANGLIDTVEKSFEEKGKLKNPAYKSYTGSMREMVEFARIKKTQTPARETIAGWHKTIMNRQDERGDDLINAIEAHVNILEKSKIGTKMIQDILDEENLAKVKDYQERATVIQKQMLETKDKYQDLVLDRVEEKAKMQKAQQDQEAQNAQEEFLKLQKIQEAKRAKEEQEIKTSYITEDGVDLKTIAQKQFDEMTKLLVTNSENKDLKVQVLSNEMLKSENPKLDKILTDSLGDESIPELVKTFSAGMLMQKEKTDVLADHTEKMLNGERPVDETMIFGADALIHGITDTKDKIKTKRYLKLFNRLFKEGCSFDTKFPKKIAGDLTNIFIQQTGGKSPVLDRMLFKMSRNRDNGLNVKLVAMQALGISDAISYKPLFEDTIKNLDELCKNDTEKISMLDGATNSLMAAKKAYPEINISVKKELQALDIDKISANSADTRRFDADEKAAIVKGIKERIKVLCK